MAETSYSSQILPASTNEQKWTTGNKPKLKPGQMIFEKGNYYWVGSDGKVQKTADINTAYKTAGFKAGEKAADVVQAATQNYNLKGAQIQYDNKTGAYYFKDPASGKMLTTTDLSTAYGIINPKANPYAPATTDPGAVSETNPMGMQVRNETYASGSRPKAIGEQFYQPVYQQQQQNYAQPGYSLMGDQSGLGALAAMQGQNTQGTARNYGVDMGPVSQYTQFANQAPTGIGQTRNPFSTAQQPAFTPQNYGNFANMAQRFQQPQQNFQSQQFQPQQQSFYGQGMQGGIGRMATPFGSAGSTGAFGGGFGGAGLYGKK